METILFKPNLLALCIIILIFTTIETILQTKILKRIFKIENIKKIYFVQTALILVIRILLPIKYCRIAEVIAQIIIYKKYLNLSLEKALFSEQVNIINFSIIELVLIKIFKVNIDQIVTIIYFAFMSNLLQYSIYFIVKKFNINVDISEYISKENKKQICIICLISIILLTIDTIEIINYINIIPNAIYVVNILVILLYSAICIKSLMNIIKIEEDNSKINELEGNNDRLLKQYDNISSFDHDFKNIMNGMGGFIKTKNLEGLEKMYNDIISEYKSTENIKEFSKETINNPAIYNLITNKYMDAKKYNIKFNLDVYIDFSTLKIKTYELCRILGILIDNAIESAKECDQKVINVKFIKDNYNNRNLIVVENSCKNYLIDINKIKEKGFTTKKNKLLHGIGLWKVNQIVKKYENVMLYTTRDKMFKQQLEIYTWE